MQLRNMVIIGIVAASIVASVGLNTAFGFYHPAECERFGDDWLACFFN